MADKQFEFADLIDEFPVQFTVSEPNGSTVYAPNGKKTDAYGPPRTMTGIILPLRYYEVKYMPNGTYTERDRKLYTKQPIKEKSRLEYNGHVYTVQAFKDYSAYADVFIYLAKGAG